MLDFLTELKELLVSLLRAPELEVVTAAAAAVARMATEDETLAVLSDHHVVNLLASLVRSVNIAQRLAMGNFLLIFFLVNVEKSRSEIASGGGDCRVLPMAGQSGPAGTKRRSPATDSLPEIEPPGAEESGRQGPSPNLFRQGQLPHFASARRRYGTAFSRP